MKNMAIKGGRTLSVLLMALWLQACAVVVDEQHIIGPGDHSASLTAQDVDSIEQMKPGIKVTPLSLARDDRSTAGGLWLRQPGSDKVLIYFGGNGTRIKSQYADFLPHMLALNCDIVWLDHRGKGLSNGEATIDRLFADGLATYDYVAANTDKKIVLHGLSLGSFVAGHVAANRPVAGLVLEGSATNADDWLDERMSWYMKVLADVHIDDSLKNAGNDKVVRQYHGPLLVMVGDKDEVTPASLSRKLYSQSVSTNKQLLVVKNLHHGDVMFSPEAEAKLKRFLQSI